MCRRAAREELLDVIDEDGSMPAGRIIAPGQMEGELSMDWHARAVLIGEFVIPWDHRGVLNGVITEIRGGIMTRNPLSEDGRGSQSCE
jgi:hypothetical protein